MSEVVIVSAVRTPIGRLGGSLSRLHAHQLGCAAVAEALRRVEVAPTEVSEVILGQVLTAGAGQNPARQAAMAAGLPAETTAFGVNQLCGSGLRAVALGYQSIRLGEAGIVVAGGQESMSRSPHAMNLRAGTKAGHATFVDTMIHDGLWDAFNDYHMGLTAENVAQRSKISRDEQDAFALRSHQKAVVARNAGRFKDEIIGIPSRPEHIDSDESIRSDTSAAALSRLAPAFDNTGTITAGNSSGLSDGAAALVLMTADEAGRRGLRPLARIASWATTGVDPALMGLGPVSATREALRRANWSLDQLDLIEANEAFAAQSCAVDRELGWERDRVNVNGGSIALGHPIGASGARILVTLLHEMKRRQVTRGLATLCIGGGMGIAMCVERN